MMKKVITVNEKDEKVGEIEKMEAHRQGVLHRAFSIFIYNQTGKILLQKRAQQKYHGGGLWANACCGHPTSDNIKSDAQKRLKEEMGFTCALKAIGIIRYRAKVGELIENEIDHIFLGNYEGLVSPASEEVSDYMWAKISWLENDLQQNPRKYTPWFKIIYPQLKKLQK